MKIVEPGGVKTDFSGRSAKIAQLGEGSSYSEYQNNFQERVTAMAAKMGSEPADVQN